ncbi:hypothetical protein ACM1RC_07525 [Paenibacillus azoreducens]|uniref:hypothetical protein n=1 Tax=Paenibacillus azoreducens TaxID=116718 RepID=UPI0039F4D0D1
MNMQNLLKKTALSALMFSAVAAPAVTNADSSNSGEQAAKTQPAIAVSAKGSGKTENIMFAKIMDPLELAKKYAPETVEEWQKTLEKLRGPFVTGMAEVVPAEKLISAMKTAEGNTGEESTPIPSTPAEKFSPASVTMKDIAEGKVSRILLVPAADLSESSADHDGKAAAITVSFSSTEAKEADSSFLKAWDALSKAEESKDAGAIKQALAELLKQYKQLIAEQEPAAK